MTTENNTNDYEYYRYLLENIDINPYNSNFTIINAQSGSIIVNKTNSILDFHLTFNETVYQARKKKTNAFV